jgi:hypothetical protein
MVDTVQSLCEYAGCHMCVSTATVSCLSQSIAAAATDAPTDVSRLHPKNELLWHC